MRDKIIGQAKEWVLDLKHNSDLKKTCIDCELELPIIKFEKGNIMKHLYGVKDRCRKCEKALPFSKIKKQLNKGKPVSKKRLNRLSRHEKKQDFQKVKKQASAAFRRVTKEGEVSKWANKTKIAAIYKQCADLNAQTGIEHNVDHVIPIKHHLVCGLHNEFNLRVITGLENRRKHNKFEPIYEQTNQ